VKRNLVDGKYEFKDLVAIDQLRNIFESFSVATGFTTGLVSFPEQELLIATGWRDVCTKFHRKNASSKIHCKTSNITLTTNLKNHKETFVCKCQNGLVDGATPIIVDGVHIANLATGQIFFTEPDLERFRKQGEEYGYDLDEYLEAVRNTPIVSEERFKKVLKFLSGIAVMLAEQALMKLRHQQISEKLKVQEEYAKTLFQDSRIPLAIIDTETLEFLDCNQAAVSIYGYEEKREIVGRSLLDVSAPLQDDDTASLVLMQKYIDRALETGHVIFRWKQQRPSGEFWAAEVQLTIIIIGDKKHFQLTVLDITERVRVKEENFQLERQLVQSRKMEAIGQLAGGIAHDFNNMLSGIMGAAQLLQSSKHLQGQRESRMVDIILKASERAGDTVSKLMVFGRKTKYDFTEINIHDVIDSTLAILNNTISKNIIISFDQKALRDIVKGEYSELQNVFLNLAINATHAMPDGGQLIFSTSNVYINSKDCDVSHFDIQPGEYIKVSVCDTGHGIPKENLEKIFEPFFTTKEQGKGTGLGLSTTYGIINGHNGSISVDSEEGVGTTFHILIPIAEKVERTGTENGTTDTTVKGWGKILLVDDEEIVRNALTCVLQEAGYDVIAAVDGLQSLEFYQRHRDVELVIMDSIMPGPSGAEIFYKLRKLDNSCKVILMSGFSKDEDLAALKADGLLAFIRKPFNNKDLLVLVSKTLGRG